MIDLPFLNSFRYCLVCDDSHDMYSYISSHNRKLDADLADSLRSPSSSCPKIPISNIDDLDILFHNNPRSRLTHFHEAMK